MIKVGITGGIGSGKTYISKIFESLNIKVYYSDLEAKKLMIENSIIKESLIKNFGNEVYFKNGELNRELLSKLIFSNKYNLQTVNNIVHPVVRQHYSDWTNKYKNEKYTLKEAAILFESGAHKQMDKIITVVSDLYIRKERNIARDNISKDEILKKINNQISDKKKIDKSDFVIYNNLRNSLTEQIHKIDILLKK